jgi:Tol biopolymer transport system component
MKIVHFQFAGVFLFSAVLLLFIPARVQAQTYTPHSLHTGPSWAPNGHVIAYSAAYHGAYDIFTVNIWSGERVRVSDHPANDLYPAWAPNGRWLAYYSDRPSELGPFPPDTIVYNVRGLYETYARDGYRPSWSPDGQTIAAHFRGEKGNYEIYLMDRRGRDRRPITDTWATNVHPRFSPDGSKIAFVSDRDMQAEIYVMDANGENQTRLTNSAAFDLDPVWSPNGSKIAFISNRLGSFDIFIMNADGSNLQVLASSPSIDMAPVWSPDGKRILFSSNRYGYFDLYVMDADGSNLERLTSSEFHEFYGTWSPQGSRIAFLSTEHGQPHLFVMNANGTRKRQLTR